MTLAQLQYFVSLAETGNISRSASLLNVSRPTITRSINDLEEEFGVPLFDKESGNFDLTEDGKYCYDVSKDVIRRLEIVESQMRIIKKKISGDYDRTVKICISPASSKTIFPRIVKLTAEMFPDINLLALEYGQVQARAGIEDGSVDFHLAADASWSDVPNGIKAIPIMRANYVCCMAKTHVLAQKQAITIKELEGYPAASFARYFDRPPFWRDKALEDPKKVNIVYRSEQLSALRSFIKRSDAYTPLLHGMIDDDPEIIGIPFQPPIEWTISLAYNEIIPKNSACRDFFTVIDRLKLILAEEDKEAAL